MGRNNIKKIEGLDGVADTLKELWMSYNSVEKLAGVEKLKALEVLFLCVLPPSFKSAREPMRSARGGVPRRCSCILGSYGRGGSAAATA